MSVEVATVAADCTPQRVQCLPTGQLTSCYGEGSVRAVTKTVTETEFDPVALAQMPDPFPVINALRAQCPVAHSDRHDGFWLLTRHADVTMAAQDPARFSSAKGITVPHHGYPITLPPIEEDPPRHQQFR